MSEKSVGLLLLFAIAFAIAVLLSGCASIPPTVGCFGGYSNTGHVIECGVRMPR
jgi:uncharacterized protein YceK